MPAVRQPRRPGLGAGGKPGGPFGRIKTIELPETGQEISWISRLTGRKFGEQVVQFVAHRGQGVDRLAKVMAASMVASSYRGHSGQSRTAALA